MLAYAAIEADVFPVDAQATCFMPSLFASLMPTVIPLSLNEPVGFSPSCLRNMSSNPVYADIFYACTGLCFPPAVRQYLHLIQAGARVHGNATPRFHMAGCGDAALNQRALLRCSPPDNPCLALLPAVLRIRICRLDRSCALFRSLCT